MNRDYQTGLKDADQLALEEGSSSLESVPLHPDSAEHAVPATHQDQSSVRALEEFASFIAAMKEKDYGDWMRRANVYCDQLRATLLASSNERDYVEQELASMKKIIQYTPNWKVIETQRSVIEKVLSMRRHFLGDAGGGNDLNIHNLDISTSISSADLH